MAEAKTKTRPTRDSVAGFLAKVPDAKRREDSKVVLKLMTEATGEKPEMWGTSIVGFGRHRYKYDSGREGEWMLAGFSPRKSELTLYIVGGLEPFADLMKRLGKYRTGRACLYIKKLEDVDLKVLKELVTKSAARISGK